MKEYKALHKKMKELKIKNEILKNLPPYSQKINREIRVLYSRKPEFIYCKTNVCCLKISQKYLL